ncbi:MAG: V-type ATP synthase subunit A [Candidatus Lokiarchaeota archaeon]|nr:V-type ATP synthase subunit A [Candidatus Lokiarchaeota archaeon]
MSRSNFETNSQEGYISAIIGSLIKIKGLEAEIRLHDLVKIIKYNILGEVIQIYSDHVVAQCFENTANLRINEKVVNLNEPLSMELAPGLLGNIFDGIQRPLQKAFEIYKSGELKRGIEIPSLSRTKKWHFIPLKKVNTTVSGGFVIGTVQETPVIEHKVMVPPEISGKLIFIAEEGEYTIVDEIYKLKINNKEYSFSMLQKWPITIPRPFKERKIPDEPLITGIRVIDLLFPITKGGTIGVPGGFGTGKTVIQQSLAKWCDADIIVFVGCGERGNEIADVLTQFSELIDPKTNQPLLNRIILIANTSNMPVSAREASIFSGVTIAEYYRDMGYGVAVLADSTSRWAESLREISGLLEEMPAEEGYPAYLPSKLSSFYERAGLVKLIGDNESGNERVGSLTIIGSISPPAGDFSEPVTATTKNFVQGIWALDAGLAYSKHYPAINWLNSYSNYPDYISEWWYERDIDWSEINVDWFDCRKQMNNILSQDNELKYITQLIGEENLPEDQQLTLFIAKLIKNGFLIQNAFDDIDNFTATTKLLGMIKMILLLYKEGIELLKQGFLIEDIKDLKTTFDILRINRSIPNEDFDKIEELKKKLLNEIESLKLTSGVFKKK